MRSAVPAAAIIALVGLTACAHRGEPAAAPAAQSLDQDQRAADSMAAFPASVGDRVYFETDRHDLSPEARQTLEGQARWLQNHRSVRILVGGNCDERGTREYNLALGARRASAVRDYLVSLGVDAARIDTVSYGKERPIDQRPSEAGWAVNRNAHSQILPPARS
jgi:peptidoglycan-associated lipoprotein